jgi:hypothetical protein
VAQYSTAIPCHRPPSRWTEQINQGR